MKSKEQIEAELCLYKDMFEQISKSNLELSLSRKVYDCYKSNIELLQWVLDE